MEKMAAFAELFVEDVNKEDSMIIELFGNIVNFLFKTLQWAGIPFVIYVLFEFAGLF